MPSGTTSYKKEMFMAFLGFSLWTVGDAIVRFLNDYPTMLIAFGGACMCVLSSSIFSPLLGGFRETLVRPQLKLRLFRGMLLACSAICAFYAFSHLDLATAYAIIFAAPLLAKVMSVLITRETIPLRSWGITMLGFVGVLIVVRPGVVPLSLGVFAALSLTVFFSLGFVLSRYIADENQTLLSSVLFQYVFLMLATAFPAYYAYDSLPENRVLAPAFLGGCIAIGVIANVGTILVSKAFSTAPTQLIAPIHYVQMVWGVLFSMLLFDEMPDEWTILGGSVIMFAGLLLIKVSRVK